MQSTLARAFEQYFGTKPTIVARAPGRVNLIGEHTDYNDGFVLPMAINRHVWVVAKPRDDNMINIYSMNFESIASFTLDELKDENLPHWTQHLRGVWYLLSERASMPSGADVLMHGDIPIGAGLSSSAAVEIAFTELATHMISHKMTQVEKALFGVEVEHEFIGVPVGVMDQMASAVSKKGHALLIDCRSLETTPVFLPDTLAVIVMDTSTRRQLVDGEYAKRRRQCEEASEILGVSHLRDATMDMVDAKQAELGDVRYRRAKHIVTENERTLDVVNAFEKNELALAGQLMNESHYSLRDDYEVSIEALDVMSDIARQHEACYGARMTGAGFGGCAVAIVDRLAANEFIKDVSKAYKTATDLDPSLYAFEPDMGSGVVWEADS